MKGHIRERGKGNWYAVLSVRDPGTGKRKVKFHALPNCKGKREAQQALARIVTELDAGAFVEPIRPPWRNSCSAGSTTFKLRCSRAPTEDTLRRSST